MFSKLFGKKKTERPALNHPRDLRLGDMIEFGLTAISDISGQTFKVSQVNSVDYGDGLNNSLVLTSGKLSLNLENINEGGEDYLLLSKLVSTNDVKSIFNMDEFSKVFEEGANSRCDTVTVPDYLTDWVSKGAYHESADAVKSTYYQGDHRDETHKNSEYFDYYELEGDDAYSVDIEVYDGGETEVYMSRKLALHVIEELWPHGDT